MIRCDSARHLYHFNALLVDLWICGGEWKLLIKYSAMFRSTVTSGFRSILIKKPRFLSLRRQSSDIWQTKVMYPICSVLMYVACSRCIGCEGIAEQRRCHACHSSPPPNRTSARSFALHSLSSSQRRSENHKSRKALFLQTVSASWGPFTLFHS